MTDIPQPIVFSLSTLAPGPADFVFDDIGFGPITGTLQLTEEMLGIPLPLIDAGVTVEYALGARLVLKVGFGTPTINVNYRISDGELVNQSSLFEFNSNPDFQARLAEVAHYHDRAIVFDTRSIEFIDTGNAFTVTAPLEGAGITLDFEYLLKLKLVNAFVELGFPISAGDSYDLGIDLINEAGTHNLFSLEPGETLGAITSGPLAGSFVEVPSPPTFENAADYQTSLQDNGLVGLSLYDTGDPFAELEVNIAKIIADAGVPIGFDLDLGFASGGLSLLKAVGTVDAAIGQLESFRADDVHVRLELFNLDGVSTGKVVAGRLGDQLMFDSLSILNNEAANLGFGKIVATYTLYGALEQQTGLDLSARLDLGLLTGNVHVDVFGFEANGSFGPLIPLPTLEFSTGLIPLVTDSKPVVFDSVTTEYAIYSERTEVGSDASGIHFLLSGQEEFDAKGGDDIVHAFDITANIIHGGAGNDVIHGADLEYDPTQIALGDKLFGMTGDDYITAGSGDDDLHGGNGADTLIGGDGDDLLTTVGIDGTDTLIGGLGTDTAYIDRQGLTDGWVFSLAGVTGGTGTLPDGTFVSGIEVWQIFLGFGDDTLLGSFNDDVINGGAGNDSLNGLAGFDILRGEGGNDTLQWWQQAPAGRADQVSGGVGLDTLDVLVNTDQDVAFNLSGVAGFLPNPQGGIGVWDDLSPSIDGVKLDADSGDFLPLLIGDFASFGSEVHTQFLVTPPELALKVRTDIERLEFAQTGSGRVFVTGGYLDDTIFSGDGDDRLDGLLGADEIHAGDGDDFVVNWDADLMLNGGDGDDTLAVIRSGETAAALVLDFAATNADGLGETSDGAHFANFETLRAEGSRHADIIRGGALADIIHGNAGADQLEGRGGGDIVDGGEGDDTITASEGLGTGVNSYIGGAGMDTLVLDWQVIELGGLRLTGPGEVVTFSTPLVLDLRFDDVDTLATGSTVEGFERLVLTSGDAGDYIVGGLEWLEVAGRGRGSAPVRTGDVIDTAGGDDTVIARGGYDNIATGSGDDTVRIESGGGHRIDGGAGYDTLVIEVGFSLDQDKILKKLRSFSFNDDGLERNVNLREMTLPDGTVVTNFESIVFDVESLADVARKSLSDLDDVVSVGAGSRLGGGKGNDRLRVWEEIPNPRPGPLDRFAAVRGGLGDDVFEINSRASIRGGDGFDLAFLNFGHVEDGMTGRFDKTGGKLFGVGQDLLADVNGVEGTGIVMGSGNDKGVVGDGAFDVDFGAGFDKAVVDHAGGAAGKNYSFGFGGGVARMALGVPEAGAARVVASGGGLTDFSGLALRNFEDLVLNAGDGDDSIDLQFAPETVNSITVDAGGGDDWVVGSFADDVLAGGAGDDVIFGLDGDDTLNGDAGDDTLDGGDRDDTLAGGAGFDDLTGGGGADRFVFTASMLGEIDSILDFNGDDGDVIDLSAIDAQEGRRGNQAFSFIGGEPFGGNRGELRVAYTADGVDLLGDINGDGAADFTIRLYGVSDLDVDQIVL